MLTLAIDTSSPRGSVALAREGHLLLELAHERPDAHAEELLPLLQRLFDLAKVDRSALTHVAVGLGPGSFTGLRVGIALAQGIALGLGIPTVGVSSLAALAAAAAAHSTAPVLGAVLDARRDELFVAAYDRELRELLPPQVVSRAQAVTYIQLQLGAQAFGFAGHVAPQCFPSEWCVPQALFPSAAQIALLAHSPAATCDVTPQYLRAPDVKLPNLTPHPLIGAPNT